MTAGERESGPAVLGHDATVAALDPLRLLDAVGAALAAIAAGAVSAPPRIAAFGPHGLLGAMPAHVPGLGLAAKLVTVFDDPAHPGRTAHQGVVALFDETDGRLLTLVDAEPLTALRTAATATAALLALARPGTEQVTVIGTGAQADAQLTLLTAVLGAPEGDLPTRRLPWPDGAAPTVTVAGRDPDRTRALAARHGVVAAPCVESAVRGADAVLCCTAAREPVVDRAWLRPGAHVSSVGGSGGPEVDSATVRDALLFAEWDGAAAAPPPAGAHELQGVDPSRLTLLGAVLSGSRPGRRDATELTLFKSTGHAALDVAAARVAHDAHLARRGSAGAAARGGPPGASPSMTSAS
ncbi:ornithine cyclodeaminase family protein [Streptomyces sp. NPDC088194]|uniref:ornithine cyclodeaminase family protein n=1 Tax=Streptomyces sp. NPDC088194 TaxID=3154931 RepID=UPI00344FC0BB